jgi:hypothetical protein
LFQTSIASHAFTPAHGSAARKKAQPPAPLVVDPVDPVDPPDPEEVDPPVVVVLLPDPTLVLPDVPLVTPSPTPVVLPAPEPSSRLSPVFTHEAAAAQPIDATAKRTFP